LAVRFYGMGHRGWPYEELESFGSHAGQRENRQGMQ